MYSLVTMAKNTLDEEWVSATQTRAYVLKNPLLDWLNRYGGHKGYRRDTESDGYDARLDFVPFIMSKGAAFEAAISTVIEEKTESIQIARSPRDIRDPSSHDRTLQAMTDGWPLIRQGVLHDHETKTFGAPDFLFRSDVLGSLFPGLIDRDQLAQRADFLGSNRWHYVVVDAKFTTLHLLASGQVGNSGSSPAYKAQLYIYNRALGNAQGYEPPRAFLLGRGWSQTVRSITSRGTDALERLGPISFDESVRAKANSAVEWVRRLRKEGDKWHVLPFPSVPELWPNAGDDSWPWRGVTKMVANELNELTQLWEVGVDKRNTAHQKGVFSWKDHQVTADFLGVTGTKTNPILQELLDVNQTSEGSPVRPEKLVRTADQLRSRSSLEFFVDFETVSNLNDDFSKLPNQNGRPLIYMIGCGHLEDGEWVFNTFLTDRLDEPSEEQAINDWLLHMNEVCDRIGVSAGTVVHWSHAEPVRYETEYESARNRHPDKSWPQLEWFDLWDQIFRTEPVVIRGSLGFGLKAVARALHSHGAITTSWEDNPVDGLGAMVGAWRCDEEAGKNGITLGETSLMKDIADYNEIDCKVMMEILCYLREHH